jgi:mannose-6-phosphate isomerase-like protein (cupin superfamily)
MAAKNVSGGTVEIPVKSEIPYHVHDKEEEIMFIYKGEGVAVIEGDTFPLEPETMVFIPPGVKHQFKNTGSGPLSFAFFYAPPGPEQNVRLLAINR